MEHINKNIQVDKYMEYINHWEIGDGVLMELLII